MELQLDERSVKQILIRTAAAEDTKALLKIYTPYVKNTAITFEYSVPSEEEFKGRMEKILQKYPYLVAEMDGEIVGYAYAGAFHERPAYEWAAETTIYVKQDRKKLGIGKKLYDELERYLNPHR